MKSYGFDVILKDVSEFSDAHVESLFEAGCDDGTPISRDGAAWIHFDREDQTLEEAIRSAVAQVQSVGLAVAKVEMEVAGVVSLPG